VAKETAQNGLPGWVLPTAGLVVIGVALATWVVTGRETTVFATAGLILCGVGNPLTNLINANRKDEP
jgi:tellurite resistance protein TehA-like permease